MGKTLAIVSGKGGVGKTMFACMFARALSFKTKPVLIIDCDAGLRKTDIGTGTSANIVFSSFDVMKDRCSCEDALVQDFLSKDLFLLPAPISFGNTPFHDGMRYFHQNLPRLIKKINSQFSYILLDCSGGSGNAFDACLNSCNEAFLVISPDVLSVHDASSVLKILNQSYENMPFHIVVNKMPKKTSQYTFSIEDIKKKLGKDVLLSLPEDESVKQLFTKQFGIFHKELVETFVASDFYSDVVFFANDYLKGAQEEGTMGKEKNGKGHTYNKFLQFAKTGAKAAL